MCVDSFAVDCEQTNYDPEVIEVPKGNCLLPTPRKDMDPPSKSLLKLSLSVNFRSNSFIGEGGFGRVYKGRLETTFKQLDKNGLQGNREFLVEVLMLSLLHHPNLVNLIGYCVDGEQRLLIYEFMALGSLEYHVHGTYGTNGPPSNLNCI
ncbi:hypothetical protein VNO80_01230 [Phaseolus coccineus]|uniref:Protein kinase domain-containing protein n=1 Tax=Phaseolus coccineus TaxID=3886 RepID=A0AAN9NZP7_PHACN